MKDNVFVIIKLLHILKFIKTLFWNKTHCFPFS